MRWIATFLGGLLIGATPFLIFHGNRRPADSSGPRLARDAAPRAVPTPPFSKRSESPSADSRAEDVEPVAGIERAIAESTDDAASRVSTLGLADADLSEFLAETRARLAALRSLRAEAAAFELSEELGLGDYDRRAVLQLALSLANQQVGESAEEVLQAYVDSARIDDEALLRSAEMDSLESRLLEAWLVDGTAAAEVRSRRRIENQERWSRGFVLELEDVASVSAEHRTGLERVAREFAAEHWDSMLTDPHGMMSATIRRAALFRLGADLSETQRRLVETLWSIHGLLE